jgi:hypothetical protein
MLIHMLVTRTVNMTGQTTGATTPTCRDVQMWLTRMLCEPSYPTNQSTRQVTKKLGTRCKLPSQVKVKLFWHTNCYVDGSDHPMPRPKTGTASWSMPLVYSTRISGQLASIRWSIHWQTWSTNNRTWSASRQTSMLCTSTYQQTP